MKPPRILIAGAGYTGDCLARHLLHHRQAEVVLLRRSAVDAPPGCRAVMADLTQPDTLTGIPQGIDKVVFCAAASRNTPTSYADLFIYGQQHLINFFKDRGDPVSRYIMMSTTGVYGDTQGEWVDEQTPAVPTHTGPADILKGETLVRTAALPSTVVRFSGIYGPNRHRLIRAVQTHKAYILPGDPVFLNQIHVDDVAGVMSHLLFLDKAEDLYLASDMEPATRGTVLSWIAEQLNAPPPTENADLAPQPRHGNKRCRNHRLVDSGCRFQYPTYREGYGALIQQGRSND